MSLRVSHYLIVILTAILLQGCGGGAGNSGGTSSSAIVSGIVQAPGGQIALLEQSQWSNQLASILVSNSYADVIGMAVIPDGTVVELVRVDPVTGTAGTPLAQTSVSAGRYSFNLTSLGLNYATTLQVRLASASGVQMRTFVTGAVANLDPNSEAGVQLVMDSIAAKPGSSLGVMTTKDLDDIMSSIDMITSAAALVAGPTTASTVITIKAKLNANVQLGALLNTKLSVGHVATGPGDIANFFPLSVGDTWTYLVSSNGYAMNAEVLSVGAATSRLGAMVLPVSTSTTSYPLPTSGSPVLTLQDTAFYLKDASGLISYGNSTDPAGLTALAPYYPELKLPAKVGDTLVAIDQTGNFDLGQDLDGDGISDTLTRYKLDKLVTGYQSIRSLRCMVVENHVILSVRLSASNVMVTTTGTVTWYLAAGIGIVKIVEVDDTVRSDGASVPRSTIVRDLIDATIGGVSMINQPLSGTLIKTISQQHNDLVYDKTRNRLYASVPSLAANGNSIAVINPDTGAILQTVAIGSEPMRLALSKGDEYLYVSLYGSGEVVRVNLATMVSDLKFSIGSRPAPWSDQLFAGDMVVLPNNPSAIVVSEYSKVWSAAFVGLAVYDGTVKRANEIPGGTSPIGYYADNIAISDDGTYVYGVDNSVSSFEFTRFSISQSGINFLDQTNGLAGNFWPARAYYQGGQIYLTNGRVIDPINKTLTGTYLTDGAVNAGGSCIPDPLLSRSYCTSTSLIMMLVSFDGSNFAKMTTINTNLSVAWLSGTTMTRFGSRGFAIGARSPNASGANDKIHLIFSDIAL